MAVLGYLGAGNLGDELIFAATLDLLAAHGHKVVALSRAPEETARRHAVESRPLREALRPGLRRGPGRLDAVLVGGGGLFQDVTSRRSLLLYCAASLLQSASLPTVWWAVGVGPLRRRGSRRLVGLAARRAHALTVRDEASRRLLEGLNARVAAVVPDPTFLLEVPHLAPPPGEGRLLVCPRPLPWRPDFLPWLLRELEAHHSRGGTFAFLPLQARTDEAICRALAAHLGGDVLPPAEDVAAFAKSAQSCDGVVSVRLHGLLLAAMVGRPAVAVAYDPKVSGHAEALGLPWVPVGGELAQTLAREGSPSPFPFEEVRKAIRERYESVVEPLLGSRP